MRPDPHQPLPTVRSRPVAWLPLLVIGLLVNACSQPLAIAEVRIASWNLNNLHYLENEALRKDAPVRSTEDLETLRRYLARLDAAIAATDCPCPSSFPRATSA